jgi:hypothetical protein
LAFARDARILSLLNNLPHALLRQPKHLPDCLQRRPGFSRPNDCFIAGDAPSKALSEYPEHRVRLSLTFFLSSRTPGTRLPFSSQEKGKCPV